MQRKIILIAHNIRSAHNVGALLRTCEGLGVEKIIFSGYTPYPLSKNDSRLPHLSRKIEKQIDKTALGAQKSQKWQYQPSVEAVLTRAGSEGYVVCALEQAKDSIPLHGFKPPEKIALLVGNEVEGINKQLLQRADHILEIPMFGKKESFNVVQAAAMALYAFRFMA